MKETKVKNQKEIGITLIALVITIIVLLILAGVSIATLTSENGILGKAAAANEKTKIEGEKEKIKLAYAAALSKKLENRDKTPITESEISEELEDEEGVTVSGNSPVEITFDDTGKKYEIYESGKVIEVPTEDMSKIYKYDTSTGYITGVKEEYLEYVEAGSINNTEIASLDNIELAIVLGKPQCNLIEEIGTYLVIPEEIEGTRIVGIADMAFNSILNLEYVKLPNTITYIGEMSLIKTNLRAINIPNSVTTIADYAFNQLEKLENMRIPSSVTTIGDSVFTGCTSLKNIYCEASSIPVGWDEDWNNNCSAEVHWNSQLSQ